MQVVRDQRLIIISKLAMREYFEKRNIQVRQVFNGLTKYFKANSVKCTLGAGTQFAQAQEWCFEIPVRDGQSVLYDILIAQGMPR